MANTLKFGSGQWATKVGSTLAYNDEGNNYKPLPFTFTRSTSATRVNKDGLIEVVTNNKPRIDFLNDSNGALLLEPQRTNLLLRSEEFDNASWVKLGQGTGSVPIVTPNYAISPDGTQNASRLQCDLNGGNTTSDRSWLYQSITDVVVQSTFSLYVKNISSETIIFTLNNGSSDTVFVPADSQWHRLYSVKTGGAQPRIGLIGGVGASDNADLLIWGSQIEAGSYATSYIPTQGAISTRVAETCSQTPPSGIIGQTEGTIYFEGSSDTIGGSTNLINFNFAANSVVINRQSTGIIRAIINTASAILLDSSPVSGIFKVAIGYKNGDSVLYVNGTLAASSTNSFTFATALTEVNLGTGIAYFAAVNQSKCNQALLFNTRLTNAELQQLTTL